MAGLQLSSRFGILNVMEAPEYDDSDEEAARSGKRSVASSQKKGNKDGPNSKSSTAVNHSSSDSANAKKRARKKKKQQAAELRDLTFNKIPPSVPKLTPARLPPGLTPPEAPTSSVGTVHPLNNPVQWEEWKKKDTGYVKDQFEDDLQKAILASKMDLEMQHQFMKEVSDVVEEEGTASKSGGVNRKERRKHLQGKVKPQPMSLHEFQSVPTSTTNGGLDEIELPKKPEPDPEYFNRVEKDVAEIISKEERKNLRKKNQKLAAENARRLQFEDNLEKRDQEIDDMRQAMEKMKEELAQVKKRNKQLCFILAQGEMKDKAEVLKQVDDLTAVKDELTAEVAELHAALEQERSKVSALRGEILRLQEKKK